MIELWVTDQGQADGHLVRLPAEEQIQPGECVADHDEHHGELAGELTSGRQEPQRLVVCSNHRNNMAGDDA
jgi:hypothetical protein